MSLWWWSGSAYGLRIAISFSSPLRNAGIFGDLLVNISNTVNGRFLWYLAKWLTPTRECIHNIFGAIRWTSGSQNPDLNHGSHFGLGRVCVLHVLLFPSVTAVIYLYVSHHTINQHHPALVGPICDPPRPANSLSSHEDWLREEKFRCQWTSCLEQLTYWTSVTWHLAGRFQSQAEDISV